MSQTSEAKPWGDVMLASFMVWMVTFVGVLFSALTRCCHRFRQNGILQRLVIPSFASGALLATCAFLLIPESLELLGQASVEAAFEEYAAHHGDNVLATINGTDTEEGHAHLLRYLQEDTSHPGKVHPDEDFTWKFGASVLGGFLFPILLHALFPPPPLACEECQQQDEEEEARRKCLQQQQEEEASAFLEIDLDRIDEAVERAVDSKDSHSAEEKSTRRTSFESCESGDCRHKQSQSKTTKEETGESHHCDGHSHCRQDDCEVATPMEEAVAVPSKSDPVKPPHGAVNIPLAMSILVGDFFHNFTDGIFLGTSFLLCDRDIGYTLVATTIYHELAQELADFIVLTRHCGLPLWKATLFNFLSGVSIMLGGVVILASDVTQNATGVILAVSSGVYLNITACECIPNILATQQSRKEVLLFLLCFAIGSIPIGLVLITHGHCEGSLNEPLAGDFHNETRMLYS